MDIRIKTMTIENFKGIRKLTVKFNGSNILVEGENGTGKSTIFDAFTWLMFGKDHNGNDQTHFDIKTIDADTLLPIERVDHSVEAELLVDGVTKTLKRIWRENWVKPKGQTEQVMKGHSSIFMVDGVDVGTKKSYDDIISQWADESVFRLLTDPLFFIGEATPWKARRDILLSLVAGKVDKTGLHEEFKDLLKEMNGDNMDTFRKRMGAMKRENKKLLEEIEAKIAAWEESMPEDVDVAAVKAQMEALKDEKEKEMEGPRAELADIDKRILDINERNREINAKVSEIYKKIGELQIAQGELLEKGMKGTMDAKAMRDDAVRVARSKVQEYQGEVKSIEREIERLTDNIHHLRSERAEFQASLKDLGKKYEEEKVKAFTYEATTKCHACGQDLPADTIEEAYRNARQAFLAEQKEAMNKIIDKAQKIKSDIAAVDGQIDADEKKIETKQTMQSDVMASIEEWNKKYMEAQGIPVDDYAAAKEKLMRGEEYASMTEAIEKLRQEALQVGRKDDTDVNSFKVAKDSIYNAIKRIEQEYRDRENELVAKISIKDMRTTTEKLIEDGKVQAKKYLDAIAWAETMEYNALSFIRADVSAQETALNSLFHVARWKMFDYTLEGGIVEMCEVTTKAGASLTSMNDAAKIQCGMDVIRVLSEHNRTWAPIFVDNAESITQKVFDTPAQVIRLKVKEGSTLTVSTE